MKSYKDCIALLKALDYTDIISYVDFSPVHGSCVNYIFMYDECLIYDIISVEAMSNKYKNVLYPDMHSVTVCYTLPDGCFLHIPHISFGKIKSVRLAISIKK